MIIKSVGVLSIGKLMGCAYALLGLLVGAIFTLLALVGALAGSGPGGIGVVFGVMTVIWLPILYGVLGFVGGVIGAAIYNVVASKLGGIELEVTPRLAH